MVGSRVLMVPRHDTSGSAGHKSKRFERENKFLGENSPLAAN